jgi:glutamate-1-semialdehyde 2,1-aminomutase
LRKSTENYGAILIFDEVMTGFRVAYGGAQSLFGIKPDLTCFGKIIGGGLPVGAYGGRHELMTQVAPQGPIYQAGTLSGNPLAMAAGIASLSELNKGGVYEFLDNLSETLCSGLKRAAKEAGIAVSVNRVGSMVGLFFTEETVKNFSEAKKSNLVLFSKYYGKMLEKGIYLAPSQFEALFVSAAHDLDIIETTLAAAGDTFYELASV